MAQLGSALDWGSRGRRFKSCQPDKRDVPRFRFAFDAGHCCVSGWGTLPRMTYERPRI